MSCRIILGDCVERMKELPENSVDAVVCDPPYHLTSIVKRFGSPDAAPCKVGKTGAYARASKGFMGQTWDGGDVAFRPETWAEVLRVLKPGGHLLAFSSTRGGHRMICAIEDAGFEIRDCIFYCYGSGFPKSHNINKVLHGKELVCDCGSSQVPQRDLRVVRGDDVSAAQSIHEEQADVLLSRLPEQGLCEARTSGAEPEIAGKEQSGLEGWRLPQADPRQLSGGEVSASAGMGATNGPQGRLHNAAPASGGADVRFSSDAGGSGEPQGPQPGEQSSVEPGTVADERGPQARGGWPVCDGCCKPIIPEGLGTALKPAVEPICLARKPLSEKSVAANVLRWGCGALNIDACRIESGDDTARKNNVAYGLLHEGREKQGGVPFTGGGHDAGRWPANLCHDGSDEVLAGFPITADSPSGLITQGGDHFSIGSKAKTRGTQFQGHGDSGSAARFFYTAKASSAERGEYCNHPTVKPIALMRWLVRLVCPRGGTILDPFMGSGSTLIAADAEQFNAIGIELSPEYAAIAERRIRDAAGLFAQVEAA